MLNFEKRLPTNSDDQNPPSPDRHSTRKVSIHSLTAYARTRTRTRTWTVVSTIAAILIISVIVIIAKVFISKTKITPGTTEVSTRETTIAIGATMKATTTETSSSTTMDIIQVNDKTTWNVDGTTIAGVALQGTWLDQLDLPEGIDIDDDFSVYIADKNNHRIVRWKPGAFNGEVVAGGKGPGHNTDQLYSPSDVIIDRKQSSLIICDRKNFRLIRAFHRDVQVEPKIILAADCNYLAMDNDGNLYITLIAEDVVKRWKEGEVVAHVVAGGNGRGSALNQLNNPNYLFVDEDHSLYVSDRYNHRVVKWVKDAKEGIIVAGAQSAGDDHTQVLWPRGLVGDRSGNIYVVDQQFHRVIRFSPRSSTGTLIVGGQSIGQQDNQLYNPEGISFDQQGNLYVVDSFNYRVQKFDIDH